MQNRNAPLTYQRIPVIGQICAGRSLEFLPIIKWRDVRLPSWARQHDKFVAVDICGDSLRDEGVLDGDVALVHLTKDIPAGSLAAILTPEGMLIKFVSLENDGKVRLESRNGNYPPRWFDLSEVDIQGRVIRTERDW